MFVFQNAIFWFYELLFLMISTDLCELRFCFLSINEVEFWTEIPWSYKLEYESCPI